MSVSCQFDVPSPPPDSQFYGRDNYSDAGGSYAGVLVDSSDAFSRAISSNINGAELIYIRDNNRKKIKIQPGRLGVITVGHTVDMEVVAENDLRTSKISSIICTTSPFIDGRTIKETMNIVSADCVYGSGIIKDIFTDVRDALGGRAKTVERLISDARNSTMDEIRLQASELGADALVSVSFQISNISNSKFMIMVSAVGTAVKLNSMD